MTLPHVNASRYITSLREGGSLPALVEADDGRTYVVKLRGAGQGALALVAEILTGELARACGLNVPRLVLIQLDEAFGKNEPDPEVQDLLKGSVGLNVGLEFLPESTTFDLAAGGTASAAEASRVVWLDAFTLNVDRSPRNPNLLCWRNNLWLIDHGASLYFHHHWPGATGKSRAAFERIQEHILLPFASAVPEASAEAHERFPPAFFRDLLEMVPGEWLVSEGEEISAEERRVAYVSFFMDRLLHSSIFEEEIALARAL